MKLFIPLVTLTSIVSGVQLQSTAPGGGDCPPPSTPGRITDLFEKGYRVADLLHNDTIMSSSHYPVKLYNHDHSHALTVRSNGAVWVAETVPESSKDSKGETFWQQVLCGNKLHFLDK